MNTGISAEETIAEKWAPIKFGTDGWRAVMGEDFTFANLERVAQAYADYINGINAGDLQHESPLPQKLNESLNQSEPFAGNDAPLNTPHIVIGYDNRQFSSEFAKCVAGILAGNNIKAVLFPEAVPTPIVSWAVRETNAAGGVVITASHNPAEFNGFKIKAPWGGSAPADLTRSVESLLDFNSPRRNTNFSESIEPELISSAVANYRSHVAEFIDIDRICSAKTRVIIDPMHGTGGKWVESFLKRSNLEFETIRGDGDPKFGGIHPEPIDQNLAALKTRVKQTGAVVGLATDGDADRLGAVNERGETMTMHEVAPILLLHLARRRGLAGGVVRTFSQSVLIKRIAAAHNLPLFETPIGFKYIADLMLTENILIGAEESGGIGVQGHIPERDGILNSLLLLEAVILSGRKPSEIVRDIHWEFGEFYFGRCDVKMDVAQGEDLVEILSLYPPSIVAGQKVTNIETRDGTKLHFADESWLLFRQSGTEPMLRIYAEATSIAGRDKLLKAGKLLTLEE